MPMSYTNIENLDAIRKKTDTRGRVICMGRCKEYKRWQSISYRDFEWLEKKELER